MSTITADHVKKFYNSIFFEGKQSRSAQISITFHAGEESLHLPAVSIFPENTIEQIMKAAYAHLTRHGVIGVIEANEETSNEAELEDPEMPVNFGKVTYRKTDYMVEQYSEENFTVRRIDNDKILEPKSAPWYTIVKMYREKLV